MRKEITIVAELRSKRGKNEARRLRAAGRIPAVIYGAGKESTAVSLAPKEIDGILWSGTGYNTIFNLEVPGEETVPVMLADWQHDPVKENLLHVDLSRVDLTKPLETKVPVKLIGEPRGVKVQGGLLEVVRREVRVECLPNNIPEFFEVDITDLMIGDNLRANQIELGKGITLISKPERVICHVVALRTSEETEAGEAEEGAEGEAAAEQEKSEKAE